MSYKKPVAVGGILAGLVVGTALPAWAYFSSATDTASPNVTAATLGAPLSVSASDSSNSTVVVSVGTGPSTPAATGYKVYVHGSPGSAVCTISGATGSCNATGLSGSTSYQFDLYSSLGNWTSATSATTTSVLTMPDAPSGLSLANGGGTGNAYINSANSSAVSVNVTLPASSSASDTVHLTAVDSASPTPHAITATTQPGIAGGGTVHFTNLNLSTFVDGPVTFKAWASNASGNVAGATTSQTGAFTKDVVAPATPTSVALANGGGTGNSFINAANVSSLSYTVAEPVSASDSTTDTVTVTLSDGTHQVTGTASGLGSSGGTVTVSGINASTLNEGTITASASVTDAAGNVSASKAAAASPTKDTIAPSAPTANYNDKSGSAADQIKGTAENGASIKITETQPQSATFTGTADTHTGAYTITVQAISGSTANPVGCSYSVTATDSAGNTSTATVIAANDLS